jgi:gluconolactonase
MTDLKEIASGLRFPEGPIALPDGSILLTEIERRTLSRVDRDGRVDVVADCGGGPNGAALGPDGRVYVTNNGGSFSYVEADGMLFPIAHPQESWKGGSIQRVDLASGAVEVLYESCGGNPLRAPNDLVFDEHGGFYFTDYGARHGRQLDIGGVYYARADGSAIHEVAFGLDSPNGIGLSPDGKRLYVAETPRARIFWWDVTGPGQIEGGNFVIEHRGNLLRGFADFRFFDSLAIDAEGWVCVATILEGGITAVSPDGASVEHHPLPDPIVTNVCFGGADGRTAYATLSGTGKLVSFPWPRRGLRLAHHPAAG